MSTFYVNIICDVYVCSLSVSILFMGGWERCTECPDCQTGHCDALFSSDKKILLCFKKDPSKNKININAWIVLLTDSHKIKRTMHVHLRGGAD